MSEKSLSRPSFNLSGHFLIAMPSMTSDIFEGSVIYIFDHNEDGAVGLIINQPSTVSLGELLDNMDELERLDEALEDTLVYFGGPVNSDKGFVLHSSEKTYRSTIGNQDLLMTSSKDVLLDYARGQGPRYFMLALGYSGWGPGQLEQEIADNDWLTVKASRDIIFNAPVAERYYRAIKLLGFDPHLLLGGAGHA